MATVRVTTEDMCKTFTCKAYFSRLYGGITHEKNDIAIVRLNLGVYSDRNLSFSAILLDDCSIRVFYCLTVQLEYLLPDCSIRVFYCLTVQLEYINP